MGVCSPFPGDLVLPVAQLLGVRLERPPLEHRDLAARRCELARHKQAGEARADDDHVAVGRHGARRPLHAVVSRVGASPR
jgi:hypothetical protein